jgi:hypothetical protein
LPTTLLFHIAVSDELYRDVSQRADRTGVSTEEWVSSVLSERVRLERQTDDFFDRRAKGASSRTLGELLDKAPNRPPDSGDGFEA